MITAELTRFYTPFGVLGNLKLRHHEDSREFWTVEKPWIHNRRDVSCIPEGRYLCRRYESRKHGLTFEIENVCRRSYILFHKGNKVKDVKGCLAIGEKCEIMFDKLYVLNSKEAFEAFMQFLLGCETFDLIIKGYRAI